MALGDWPASDREAWHAALAPAKGFDEPGAAAHWADVTKAGAAGNWGRYLTFLAGCCWLSPADEVSSRVTPGRIRAYRAWLEAEVGLSSISVWGEMSRLCMFLHVVAPDVDWAWLRSVANRLHAGMERKTSVVDKLIPPDQLLRTSLRRLAELERSDALKPKRRASKSRDWLMIAMLACWPIRLRNLTEIRVGHHLVREMGAYVLRFAAIEVKNRQRLEWLLPDVLTSSIDRYLATHRPILAEGQANDRLWLTEAGRPFKAHALLQRLSKVTKRQFGVSYTTRFFRYSGATAIVERAPDATDMASVLLGHKQLTTAYKHYIHPATNVALKNYADLIATLTRDTEKDD